MLKYLNMSKIYIDSTLRHDWNVQFNIRLCKALENRGIDVYLPQRDTNQSADRSKIFDQNHKATKDTDKLLAVALNEGPNWGTEIGFCHGIGKKIIALTTSDHEIPLMAEHMISQILRVEDINNIDTYIDRLIKVIKLNS